MNNPLVETFYILDFDRCVGNTDALFDIFEKVVVEHTGLTAWTLRNVREEVEAVGDSFDTATYVRAQLHMAHQEDKWRELEEGFVAACAEMNMLLPGARELMVWFEENNLPYGTVTYGEATWQELKLRAAGLGKMPKLITTNKHKGSVFQEWRQQDGTFLLPRELGGLTAKALVLIDDKAVSFDNFPAEPSHGYWVLPKTHMLPSQKGTVPANILRVANLKEVLKDLVETAK